MRKILLSISLFLCCVSCYAIDLYTFEQENFVGGYTSKIEGITRVEFAADGIYVLKDGNRIAVPTENLKHFNFYYDPLLSVQAPEVKLQCEVFGDILSVNAQEKIDNISVYTIGGIAVRSVSPQASATSVSLGDLSRGVYVVRIATGKDVIIKKIVK
ncbi:MAG: T9SS type A sorting domain-containing protein [Muribaculaceae bacterium]